MQQYLVFPTEDNLNEVRIRKVKDSKGIKCFITKKSYDENNRLIRDEQEEISEEEFDKLYNEKRESIIDEELYQSLKLQADQKRKTLNKTRFSFVQGQEYFVLDMFSENEYKALPNGKAIVESKGATEIQDDVVTLKGFSNVKDITNDSKYNNAILAFKNGNIPFKAIQEDGRTY